MSNVQFDEVIYILNPLRFNGISFVEFYQRNKNLDKDMAPFVFNLVHSYRDKFLLPEDTNLVALIYFWLQRDYSFFGFPRDPYPIQDETGPLGSCGPWSHFYLLYLHLYREKYPSYLCINEMEAHWRFLTANGIEHEVATHIRREMIGYRGDQPFHSRNVPSDELQNLANHATEKDWLTTLTDSSMKLKNRPDVILALSFKGNGFSTMMMTPAFENNWKPQSESSTYLVEKTMLFLSCNIPFSLDNDENRAVMFMLQLWLLQHPEKAQYNSREHLVFCLLYLHLYREPLSAYFTRQTFTKRWQQFTFDEKEAVAANMRRHLTQVRNEAAKTYPLSNHAEEHSP